MNTIVALDNDRLRNRDDHILVVDDGKLMWRQFVPHDAVGIVTTKFVIRFLAEAYEAGVNLHHCTFRVSVPHWLR